MTGVHPFYSVTRSPFMDINGQFGNVQHIPRCRDMELNVMDCQDVYGKKGLIKQCRDVYEDYYECVWNEKSKARILAMEKERTRQYLAGERDKKNRYAETPKLDSFHKTYVQGEMD
ncbi:uncharacterized protein LOC129221353 [Uloborus diversus]|uniref:uncharacterized protein LOC129221353 n=1 Tax=Uloborus diversus TaxID=327109 RepID=UPI00240A0BC4|nr:uncharacterized protein LOC129221353 [Uloborus diversus]